MADDPQVTMTVSKMARMTTNTTLRERKRCARIAIEWGDAALGRGDQHEGEAMYALAETLSPGLLTEMEQQRERARLDHGEPVERVAKTTETAAKPVDMAKFVVEGVENEKFLGWDAGLRDSGLPPEVEHGDIEQAVTMIRRGQVTNNG